MTSTTTISNEKGVKARVKKLLDKYGWFWWMPPANGYGQTGISDFHAIKDGVFLAIETKFGANKPTPMQKAFLQSICAADGFGFVVNENTLEHLELWLKSFSSATSSVAGDSKMSHEDGATLIDTMLILQSPFAASKPNS